MKKMFLAAVVSLVATAGFAQQKTVVEFEDTQARMLDIESNAIFKPMVVEIDMLPTGRVTKDVKFDRNKLDSFKGDVNSLRSWATFVVCNDTTINADVLVAATYDVTWDSNKGEGHVIVVGFPAVFKNWHPIGTEDMDWIRAAALNRNASRSMIDVIEKKDTK